ncbi:MAG: histidine phosphotransferase family protein, partial [Robiginitomaculum sp.]|nr:histidine phosphotransferase family protein [Robiginitomaculum sp.]
MSENITKLTAADLAALLCARICHDLVGPVSALETGLDLLNDDDNLDMHDDAIELIKVGAEQASSKLQFLRIAFGAGGSAPTIIATAELERLSRGVYPDGKVTFDWNMGVDGLNKPAARVLLNLVMLSVQSIPLGGTVAVNAKIDGAQIDISLLCKGKKARLDPAIAKTLAGGAPQDGFSGRTIQPFYTGMIAREAGGTVSST